LTVYPLRQWCSPHVCLSSDSSRAGRFLFRPLFPFILFCFFFCSFPSWDDSPKPFRHVHPRVFLESQDQCLVFFLLTHFVTSFVFTLLPFFLQCAPWINIPLDPLPSVPPAVVPFSCFGVILPPPFVFIQFVARGNFGVVPYLMLSYIFLTPCLVSSVRPNVSQHRGWGNVTMFLFTTDPAIFYLSSVPPPPYITVCLLWPIDLPPSVFIDLFFPPPFPSFFS